MTNPAEDLYQIFDEWRSEATQKLPGNRAKRVFESRKLEPANQPTNEAWEKQRYAAQCIQAIHRIIKEMEMSGDDVSAELNYFQSWSKAVFAYPGGFEKHGSGVSDEAFMSLKMFRNLVKNFVPDLNAGVIADLTDLLQNEPELTVPEGSYPAELYDYFTRVKRHLQYCLTNFDHLSYFDVRDAAEHYRAAVFMVSNESFVGNPATWKKFAFKLFDLPFLKSYGQHFQNDVAKQLSNGTLHVIESGVKLAIESSPGS